jgi:hypothetical protein
MKSLQLNNLFLFVDCFKLIFSIVKLEKIRDEKELTNERYVFCS